MSGTINALNITSENITVTNLTVTNINGIPYTGSNNCGSYYAPCPSCDDQPGEEPCVECGTVVVDVDPCDCLVPNPCLGPQGAQGATGQQGAQGVTGSQGAQGSQGVQGATGAQGPAGGGTGAGTTGPQGATGQQGVTGAQGAQGFQGAQGVTGATGAQGSQGFQGDTGAQGFQGVTGATGAQGSQGFQGATGAQGSQGFQGTTGDIGPQGFQGATGATGAPGSQGFQGATGAQGFQGTTGGSPWITMNGVGVGGTAGYTGIGVTGRDVLIYGNLLVTGGIDPIYLALTPQASGPTGFTNPLWVDSVNSNALRSENIYISQGTTGGITVPILKMENTNTTGAVGMEVYKNKPTGGTAGDVLFQQSVYGKDSFLNKQEYTRITHTIRDLTGGAEDGSIEMGAFVNGSFNNFLQINGNQNEVNCLKTLDMGGNDILTTTGNMAIQTTSSSGNGDLTITAKRDLQLLSAGSEIIISTASSTGSGDIDIIGKGGSITTIQATLMNITANGANINLNANSETVAVVGSALTFNTVNIIPRFTFSALAFSVAGSPTTAIVNFGALNDMIAGTSWRAEVSFYTGVINTKNVITYLVLDTTSTDVVLNSVFGYANGGLQTAIQYDPTGTPMGTYCSFTDVFALNATAVGGCSFVLTGGTSDGSSWFGACRVSIVLTRLS
jgi:hypothetical protein